MKRIMLCFSIMIACAIGLAGFKVNKAHADATIIVTTQTVDANSPVMKTSVFEPDVGASVAESVIYMENNNVIGNDDVGVCGELLVATTPSATDMYSDVFYKNSGDVDIGTTDIDATWTGSPRYPLKALITSTVSNGDNDESLFTSAFGDAI